MANENLAYDFYAKTQRMMLASRDERHFRPRQFFYNENVVLQEVPDEISICFNISGCPLNCVGCSWRNTELKPRELTRELYEEILEKNKNLASCVVFMGGDWKRAELAALLSAARAKGYKTCMYTGKTTVDLDLLQLLDFVKLGPWQANLGGLDRETTNQAFFKIEKLNHIFRKKGKK